jgi:hypothetical protein
MRAPQVLAYVACMVSGSLWFVFLYFNPYTTPASFPTGSFWWAPTTQLIAWIQIVLSAVGALVAWWKKPYLMYVIFWMLFMPFGLYVSLSRRIWVWIGVAELAYLAAAVWLHRLSGEASPTRGR